MPQLGFGIMRFNNYTDVIDYSRVNEAITEYMKGEFCYFDLHPAYVLHESQSIFKQYVADRYDRNRYLVANKIPFYGIDSYSDYERVLKDELSACGVEYFDYYMLHAVTADVHAMHERIGGYKFLSEAKKNGFIRNIGISFHDGPTLLDAIISKNPDLDFIQLQINWKDWDDPVIRSRENYKVAESHAKKVIVMEPLKGGTLVRDELGKESTRMGFSFFSDLRQTEIVLSGMVDKNQVSENRKIIDEVNAGRAYKEQYADEYKNLRIRINERNVIPCTGCKYCVDVCPRNIAIPDIFNLYNTYETLSLGKKTILGGSVSTYRSITHKKGKAGECLFCGKCEKRCPQKISIRDNLQKAKAMFEDNHYYSIERNAQILVYLLKENNIKNIVISPGTTNICFVQSVQCDPFFNIYSAADERSAGYIAVGLARETEEPVVLSCTGATASRNYMPALTEAFYSKLPVIAVTSSQRTGRIGHQFPQMTDRTQLPNDVVSLSVELPFVNDEEDEWTCSINANRALLTALDEREASVHINLVTGFSPDFSVRQIAPTRVIRKHKDVTEMLPKPDGQIGIFCGAHTPWGSELVEYTDRFCEKYNAVVISDHTGNYKGEYGVTESLVFTQEVRSHLLDFDLLIHIGGISGAYYNLSPGRVWRVNPDGKAVDTFKKLTDVFEMTETEFFRSYLDMDSMAVFEKGNRRIDEIKHEEQMLKSAIEDLPFSNIWMAMRSSKKLPVGAAVHFGILNSLRAWNLFEITKEVDCYSNVGGFGIDGCVSSLIGASLAEDRRLFFGIVGDLAFFYDMNSIGNRHVGSNLRLMVVNNGCGTEFLNYNHFAQLLSESEQDVIAAKGHYGNKSDKLIRSYAETLGFKYMTARNKEEFEVCAEEFFSSASCDSPMLLEAFTDSYDESEALRIINTLSGTRKATGSDREIMLPKKYKNSSKINIVLWGTGNCYQQNIGRIKQFIEPLYICDNDKRKWGIKIDGVKCLSPQDIKSVEDVFVVIMIQNAAVSFQIANQLIDMGIEDFDIYDNWKNYGIK